MRTSCKSQDVSIPSLLPKSIQFKLLRVGPSKLFSVSYQKKKILMYSRGGKALITQLYRSSKPVMLSIGPSPSVHFSRLSEATVLWCLSVSTCFHIFHTASPTKTTPNRKMPQVSGGLQKPCLSV